jgi:RNA polymerase sigma factor (sigma-70 family)
MPDSGPSDADLLADWLDRHREAAFHALVARYAGLVHMAAKRTCGDDSLAAEASQLAFIALARKARSLVSRSSLAGWLHLTAVMQAKNLLRHHHRENRKRQLLRTHMESDTQGSPADTWQRMQPVLDDALAALSSSDREALLLRFYRSLSVREIAAALGIATDAAQKRLDRATARLRDQLARRGCQVGGSLGAVLLAGFATDAQASLPAASLLASKALAASAAAGGTSTLTTIAILIMTKKTALTAGAVLLLAGAGAVALINNRPAETADSDSPASGKSTGPSSSTLAPVEDASARSTRRAPRDPAENPDLVNQYGEARTNLSKHVAGNVISLLEDAVEMGEMASSGDIASAFGGPRAGLRMGLGRVGRDLELTEDQQNQAAELYADFQKRELERSKETIDRLKKDPTALMKLMLASDAFSRGEITEEQYKELQTASGEDLQGVLNPLDRENFRGGQPLQDEAFRSGFQALLDPGQGEKLQASLDEQAAKAAEPGAPADPGNIANLPAMELEKLDETVVSAKKLTGGLKQMMEGMGGLQDLGPLMEQQRQRRSGGEQEPAPAE